MGVQTGTERLMRDWLRCLTKHPRWIYVLTDNDVRRVCAACMTESKGHRNPRPKYLA